MTSPSSSVQDAVKSLVAYEGKVVLVTGAAGQLGSALSTAFEAAGAKVVRADLTAQEDAGIITLDVANQGSVDAAFAAARNLHGHIDVLINNAGVSCFEPFDERSEENLDWVYNVNLKGPFLCLRAFASAFPREGATGSIVNIASLYGVVSPDPRIYADGDRRNSEIYGATKAGVIQMTKYFAVHLADRRVRVNAISPGGIFNPEAPQGASFIKNYEERCPMGRMARVSDMVGAALFLASDSASYVNGHNLVVDGGFSAW